MPKEIITKARKYAAIFEDLAIKSTEDQIYWLNWQVAKLLRSMSDRIEELENGKIACSPAKQTEEQHIRPTGAT